MRIEKNTLDGAEIISLINEKTGENAQINLSIGASLIHLELAMESELSSILVLPGNEKNDLANNPLHPSALLTPWVNRVRNGNYSFLGKNYQLPINEENLGNSIHGFLARKPFQLSREEIHPDFCVITATFVYDGIAHTGFPFPFDFHLKYTFFESGKLQIHFQAVNTGTSKMPFACGWHPYFGFPKTPIEACELKFSAIAKFLSDAQMIPFQSEKVDYQNGANLNTEKLDNVFLLEKMEYHIAELKDATKDQSIFVGHSSEIFPYFVAFIPEGYSCIALEPMTANTDAFNTFEGLISLEPSEEFNGIVDVWLGKSKKI